VSSPNTPIIGSSNVYGMKKVAATLSPAEVAANTTAEQLLTVDSSFIPDALDAAADVVVVVNKPTAQAGLGIVGARYVSPTQIGVTFVNATGDPITPTASQVYRILFVW